METKNPFLPQKNALIARLEAEKVKQRRSQKPQIKER